MKNFKILKKVMLLALTLVMLVGVFAVNSFAATNNAVTELQKGIDFNNFAVADPSQTLRDNIYKSTGLYFNASSNVKVVQVAEGDNALMFDNGATFLKVSNPENTALNELFFSENGPSEFTLEFDLTITKDFGGTADSNNTAKNPLTAHRGYSVLNFGSGWLFKATAPGVGTINLAKNESGSTYKVDKTGVVGTSGNSYWMVESVNAGTENVGYFYKDNTNYYMPASSKMGWAGSLYTGDKTGSVTENGVEYISGITTGAITNGAINAAVTYTLGEASHFEIQIKRTAASGADNDTMKVKVLVDGKTFINEATYTTNAENSSNGIRITDIGGTGTVIDNMKITVTNCGGNHGSSWTNYVTTYDQYKDDDGNVVATYHKNICTVCGATVASDVYEPANIIIQADSLMDEGGNSCNTVTGKADDTGKNRMAFVYIKHNDLNIDFSDEIFDNDGDPIKISFNMKVDALPETFSSSGHSILTWIPQSADGYYYQFLRLFEGGEIRLINSGNKYSSVDSTFRFSEGKTYAVDVILDTDTGVYEVYFDGKFFGREKNAGFLASAINSADTTFPKLRFGDAGAGEYTIGEVTFTEAVSSEKHTHTDAFSDSANNIVAVDDTSVSVKYLCYCGEYADGPVIKTVLKDNLVDVYEGTTELTGAPTTGEYWIAFDYNVRSATAISGAGVDILKIGDSVVLGSDAAVTVPTTVGYALNVKYTDVGVADVDVYVDGEYVKTLKSMTIDGDAAVITFGDADVGDVRFNYIKVVELGDAETAAVPTYIPNELRPCYHANYSVLGEKFVYTADGTLTKQGTCSACGEPIVTELIDKFEPDIQTQSDVDVKDHNFKLGAPTLVRLSESVMAKTSTTPYVISFDLNINEFYMDRMTGMSNTATAGRNLFGYGAGGFDNIIRMFLVADDDGEGYRDDCVDLRNNNNATDSTVLGRIYVDTDYHIELHIIPNTGEMDIYIDGVFKGSKTLSFNGGLTADKYVFRFFEGQAWGDADVTNFHVYSETEGDVHTHTDKWCTSLEKGVLMTDAVFEHYYYCYCGEKVSYGDISEIINNNLPNVYEGLETIELASADAGTWIATDINIRDAAANGNLVTLGDAVLVALEDGMLVYENGDAFAPVEAPTTYSIAIKLLDDGKYEMYVDGELYAQNMSPIGTMSTTLVLGDEVFGENVKFNYNRVVKIGETETPLAPTYDIDETLRPCYHKDATPTEDRRIALDNNGVLNYMFICTECSERVYVTDTLVDEDVIAQRGGLTSEELKSFTASTDKYIRVDTGIIGSDATAPYWFSFDVTPTALPKTSGPVVTGTGSLDTNKRAYKGWGLVTVQPKSNTFTSELRIIADGWEEGNATYDSEQGLVKGVEDGKAEVHLVMLDDSGSASTIKFRFSKTVAYLEVGKTTSFALYIDPATGAYDVYVDGVYVASALKGGNTDGSGSYPQIRFLDGEAPGTYKFENVNLISTTPEHTHSDEWLTNDENTATTITFTDDHKLAYVYKCYCGETVTYGISEKHNESVIPTYGITDETVAIASADFAAPADDFWFVTAISAMELPTEGDKNLVAIGDKVLLGINTAGEFLIDGDSTGVAIALDNEYHTLAFRFDVSKSEYTVYFDGAYIGDATYDALAGDVKFASEGAGKYHFDQAAVVTLAEGGDMAYLVAEGAHTHWYNANTSSLIFNEERTTITIEYTCVECNRPAVDGIVENLYDADGDAATVDSIAPVYGTETAIIEDSAVLTGETPYWLSMDIALKSEPAASRKAIMGFVGSDDSVISILTLDANGNVKDSASGVLCTLTSAITNVTINVVKDEEGYSYNLYIDGDYIGTYELALDSALTYDVVLGNTYAAGLEFTNIKFAEMGNGGTTQIGAFICADADHTVKVGKATYVKYLDVNEFKFVYKCTTCGATVTEEIVHSYYTATPHIYEAEGELGVAPVEPEQYMSSYWIVADINLRGNIGIFSGYVPLISDGGTALLLIDYNGKLMLGDGTKLPTTLVPKNTYNVALRCEDGKVYVFIDGAYVGCSTGTVDAEGIVSETSYEYFGSPALHNIRYYNIKSIETAVTDDPISVDFVEDLSVIPCVHPHHYFDRIAVRFDGEYIEEFYICDECGERVHIVNDIDLFDPNAQTASGVEDGEFTVTGLTPIRSTEDVLGKNGAPYWVRFTVEVEDLASPAIINAANKGAGLKGGVTFFGTSDGSNYGHILRLFTVEDGEGGYYDDRVMLRTNNNRNATYITTLYEGETYEFAIAVLPHNGAYEVYLDGKFVVAAGSTALAFDKSSYFFRFLDGAWGTFNVSDFEFVKAGHEHSPKYSEYITNGYDVLAFTESTLTHRYTCYCGQEIVEGIKTIYADPIENVVGASTATAINGGTAITMGSAPYWLSAKVYNKGEAANVYSVNGTDNLVEIANNSDESALVFKVGGVETTLAPSASGSYDVISVKVYPTKDIYDVYVNGAYLASGVYDFIPNADFNILLGGSGLDFENIKLVTLAEGYEGKVASCGDHSFNNSAVSVKIEATDGKVTKLVYTCSFCGAVDIREIAPGDAHIFDATKNEKELTTIRSDPQGTAPDSYTYETDYYDELVSKTYTGNRWITFDVTATDVANLSSKDGGAAFLCWTYNNNPVDSTVYSRFLRAFYVDANTIEIKLTNGGTNHIPAIGNPTISEGETHSFAIEYNTSTGVYHVYMDGEYIGEGYNVFDHIDSTSYPAGQEYKIRFMDGNAGDFTFSNINVFNGTTTDLTVEEDEEETVVGKAHFPASDKPGTVTYADGEFIHEFECACGCGQTIKYQKVISLQDPALNKKKFVTEYIGISSTKSLYLPDELLFSGAMPYWFSVDITADSINTEKISPKTNGASILAVVAPHPKTTSDQNQYLHLIRAYYKDGKIMLSSPVVSGVNAVTYHEATAVEFVAGETVKYVFAVDPTTGNIIIFINGEYKAVAKYDVNAFVNDEEVDNSYIRFLDNNWGTYDFTNIKFGAMSDECAHTGDSCETCENGLTYTCSECKETAVAVHNYVATTDATGKWTKYTCEDCGAYYLEFNNKSLISDMTFATDALLMEYLTKTYFPVFTK